MIQKYYYINKTNTGLQDIYNDNFWQGIEEIKIKDYLWMKNDYRPEVFVKACYSSKYFYLKFTVYEQKVTVRYINIGDPVYKDSCVEFFINLFPNETQEYFNIEFNAIGTIKMGYGIKRSRSYLTPTDLNELKIFSTIKAPVKGYHGSDNWKLFCALPISLLERISDRKFIGNEAAGNFFKCGDETEFKHYGMWNLIDNPNPDFHLPEYFGKIIFSK